MPRDMSVHFSSKKTDWATPQDLFDRLNKVWGFTLDVCANDGNAKCKRYFTEEDDGLSKDWSGDICWMNPPYGRAIKQWIKKAYEESQKGATVVCLIPSRTDTVYWHEFVMKGEVEFIKGRIKFGGAKAGAPFPSAIVVFKPPESKPAWLASISALFAGEK